MSTIPEVTDATFERDVLKSPVPVLVLFWMSGWWFFGDGMLVKILRETVETLAIDFSGRVKVYQMNLRKNSGPPMEELHLQYAFLRLPSVLFFANGEHVEDDGLSISYDTEPDSAAMILNYLLDKAAIARYAQSEAPSFTPRVKARQQEPPGPRMSTEEIKASLIELDGLICQGCDRTFDDPSYLEVDHIVPRSDGGVDHISNRMLVCGPCNRIKSNRYTLSGLRHENARRGRMARE